MPSIVDGHVFKLSKAIGLLLDLRDCTRTSLHMFDQILGWHTIRPKDKNYSPPPLKKKEREKKKNLERGEKN